MSHPVKGIDHAYLLTADLEGAAEKWRRLGFTLSPRGTHSAAKGTANHTIIFEHDYFELLGIIAETPDNLPQRESIARDGDGLHAIACRIGDAHEARAALSALGIEAGPVSEFSRPLPLPDGSTGEAAFAVTHFGTGEAPSGAMFMCQHKTPEMVWRPELKSHANGATGLAGIVAISEDPAGAAKRFARLFAEGKAREASGGHLVETGQNSAPILCLSRQAAAERWSADAVNDTPAGAFAALQITVADLAKAQAVLREAGLETQDSTNGFWIAPADSSGVIVEFVVP